MKIILGIIHILVCLALIAVVMMQQRKSGGFTGAFGGSATQADAGGAWKRMTGLTKASAVLMAAFMVISVIQVVIR